MSAMRMTATQWRRWAQQRRADAPLIAKAYERQAESVDALLQERGCSHCDPLVTLGAGQYGGPSTTDAYVTHELGCPSSQ